MTVVETDRIEMADSSDELTLDSRVRGRRHQGRQGPLAHRVRGGLTISTDKFPRD